MVTAGQNAEVGLERTSFNDNVIELLVEFGAKRDVVTDCAAHNPRVLGNIGLSSLTSASTATLCRQNRTKTYNRSLDSELTGQFGHFTEDGREDGGLARADTADDGKQLALLGFEVDVLQNRLGGEARPRGSALLHLDQRFAVVERFGGFDDVHSIFLQFAGVKEADKALSADEGLDSGCDHVLNKKVSDREETWV